MICEVKHVFFPRLKKKMWITCVLWTTLQKRKGIFGGRQSYKLPVDKLLVIWFLREKKVLAPKKFTVIREWRCEFLSFISLFSILLKDRSILQLWRAVLVCFNVFQRHLHTLNLEFLIYLTSLISLLCFVFCEDMPLCILYYKYTSWWRCSQYNR